MTQATAGRPDTWIERRRNGRFRARFRWQGRTDGATFDTRPEAEHWLTDRCSATETPSKAPSPARGVEPSGITLAGDTAAAVLPPGASLADLDALLRARGIDPADWIVERVTVNEWEALADGGQGKREPCVVKLHQLKAFLRHRAGTISPASEVERRPRAAVRSKATWGRPLLSVVCGDQQAPYQDEALHRVFLRWLTDVRPDNGVLAGDTMDLPTVSRHRDRIRWNAGVQECVNVGYRLISEYRDASPETDWSKLLGNHDWRIESEMMQRAERMAFVGPAAHPDLPAEPHLYSVRRLLHLDALGIELAGCEGEDWRYGEVRLATGVVVRHEPPSQVKAARLNRSVMAGHTHRQAMRSVTAFDENDDPVVRTVVEVGCMARTREGLGYTEHPDWQAGFATVAIYPDGTHHFDLATWRNGALTWRGERWGA